MALRNHVFEALGLPLGTQLDRTAKVRTRMPGGVGGAAPRGVPYLDLWHFSAVMYLVLVSHIQKPDK